MKPLHIALATGMLLFAAATASASNPQTAPSQSGQIPAEQLAELGLEEMDLLSDTEAEQVRGRGPLTARVFTSGVMRPLLITNPQLRRDVLVRQFVRGLIFSIHQNPNTL